MKDLTRQYDRLTVDERFRLFIEASGRNDLQELDRLNDTCPQKLYRADDWDYTQRKVRLFRLAMFRGNQVANVDCLAYSAFAFLLACGGGPSAEEMDIQLQDVLVKFLVKRRSMIEGWNRFCRDLGLPPEKVTEMISRLCGERDELMTFLDDIVARVMDVPLEPDESQTESWHTIWHECWGDATESRQPRATV